MAAAWLQTTKRLFGRPPPEEVPQPFELRCACGHEEVGVRLEHPLQIACGGCARTLFVLPRCVYPIPRPSPASLPPSVPVKSKAQPPTAPAVEKKTTAAITATRTMVAAVPVRPSRLTAWRIAAAKAMREAAHAVVRKLTPSRFQLLVLGIVLAVGLTGYAMFRSRQRAGAEVVLGEALRRGRTAIAARDFVEAAKQFQQAVDAIDVLGRDDPAAREIRQFAREANAVTHLCPKPLHELLADASATDAGRFGLSWSEVFRTSFRDTWLVCEALVTRKAAGGAGDARYLVDHPVFSGSQSAALRAELRVFDVLGIETEPRYVIFAAQLQDFAPGPPGSNSWTLTLRPDTAFLWSLADNLDAIGMPVDDQTKAILAEQSRRLGIGDVERKPVGETSE